MNNRRQLVVALGAGVLAWAGNIRGQSIRTIPRIGFLDPSPSESSRSRVARLRAGLAALGFKEGVHYLFEYRSAEGHFERLHDLADDLVRLPVQVIVVRNTPGILAARKATQTIPLIMADVGDPVALGFAKSLARPGGNITGVSNATLELLRKRLELLIDTLPSIRRIAVLGNSADQNTPFQLAEVHSAARQLRIDTQVYDVRTEVRISEVLAQIAASNPHALLPLVNPLYRSSISPRIVAWALKQRVPVMHAFREEVETGGLMMYAADLSDHYSRVASYVDRILKGAKPGDIPVERPTRFELFVNLKTARTLGITIPPLILARADRVIEW
jgi:putative ABC transport system substrate-binding protein